MDNELLANIAVTAAFEALELMAAKAGVSPEAIMDAVLSDEASNTARYFQDLVGAAITHVPSMVGA